MDKLLNWEKPVKTAVSLLIFDIVSVGFICLSKNIFTLLLVIAMFHFAVLKLKGEKKGNNDEECRTKMIYFVYDELNNAFDFTRKIMYLEEPHKVIIVILTCLILACLGKCLSSFIIILIAINLYVIFRFAGIKDRASAGYEKVYKIVGDNAKKYIPTYKEE